MTLYAFPPAITPTPAITPVSPSLAAPAAPSHRTHEPEAPASPCGVAQPVLPPAVSPAVPAVPTITVTSTVAPVAQQVTVTPMASRTDLLAEQAEWSWQELRDYVVAQIERISGPFPRDARKEYGVFNRFLNAYGQDGIAVARYAFEVCAGWWNGAPISINRFAKGSDPYFVVPILARLKASA